MDDALRDAVQVTPQVVRLRGQDQSTPVVQEKARAIVKLMREKGIPLEDLLAGLDEERAAIYEERYSSDWTLLASTSGLNMTANLKD